MFKIEAFFGLFNNRVGRRGRAAALVLSIGTAAHGTAVPLPDIL